MRTFAHKHGGTQQTISAKPAKPDRTPVEQNREMESILHLQRTIGNQAVQRMLRAATHVAGIRPKLTDSTPGDIYKQRAAPVKSNRVQRTAEDIREELDNFRSLLGVNPAEAALASAQRAWRRAFGIRRLLDDSEGRAVLDTVRQAYGGAISLQFLQWLEDQQVINSGLSRRLETYLSRYRDVQAEWFRQHSEQRAEEARRPVEMPPPAEVMIEPTVYTHDIEFLEHIVNRRSAPLGMTILMIGGRPLIESYNAVRRLEDIESIKDSIFPFPSIYPADILTRGRCRIAPAASILMQDVVHLPVRPPWNTQATPPQIRTIDASNLDAVNAMRSCPEGQPIPFRMQGTPNDAAFEALIRRQEDEHVASDQRTVRRLFNSYRDRVASMEPPAGENCEEWTRSHIRQIRDSHYREFFRAIDSQRSTLDDPPSPGQPQPLLIIGPQASTMGRHSHWPTFVRGNCNGVIFTWQSHPAYSSGT